MLSFSCENVLTWLLVWNVEGVGFGMLREFGLLGFGGLVCYVAGLWFGILRGFGLVYCGGLDWP